MKSVLQKAKELGITRQGVLLRIKKNKINAVKVGRSYVIVE